jgi:hypothetical protein
MVKGGYVSWVTMAFRLQTNKGSVWRVISTEPGQSVTSRVSAILLAFTDCDERSLTDIARLAGCPSPPRTGSRSSWRAGTYSSGTRMVTTTLGSPLRRIGTSEWRAPTLVERASCVSRT